MNSLVRFFHEFWNPHCEHCLVDKNETKDNIAIAVLKSELDRVNRNNERLLEQLFDKAEHDRNPVQPIQPIHSENHIALSRAKSWPARQRELEQASRDRARVLAELKRDGLVQVSESDLDSEIESVKAN